jgi:hypothetical protein
MRFIWALALLVAGSSVVRADLVTITPHPDQPGRTIPDDFLGISIETQSTLPDAAGKLRYRADNKPLVTLFKTLGLKSLRVGGNTVDDAKYGVPSDAVIDGVFQFAKAADAKVVWSFRLKETTDFGPAAMQAKYISDHYADQLDSLAIGNEPDFFPKTSYEKYFTAWSSAAAVIEAADPGVKLCGPCAGGNEGKWTRRFADDIHAHPMPVSFVCQHYYFGGNARAVKDAAAARAFLLSPKILEKYQAEYDKWVPAVMKDGLPYRLEETNSLYNGGAVDVSDAMASSLWALQYLYWWADHGAAGINLHSGDRAGSGLGDFKFSSNYALFWETEKGYEAKPIAYAAAAFSFGAHGRMIPVDLGPNAPLTLAVYGTVRADGAVCLTSPKHDPAEKVGVTFGGGAIGENGTWSGKSAEIGAKDGAFAVAVPPISATVVVLSSN